MSTRIVCISFGFLVCMTSGMYAEAAQPKDVNALVVNTEDTAVPVSVTADSTEGGPVQFLLSGSFGDGQDILGPAPQNYPPQSITISASGDQALFVDYISCQAAPLTGQSVYVGIVVVEQLPDFNRVAFRAHTPLLQDTGAGQPDRNILASNDLVDFCVGPGCSHFQSGYQWSGKLELEGRRGTTTDFARVDCLVKGHFKLPVN